VDREVWLAYSEDDLPMHLKELPTFDPELFYQLAALTGIGWTVSLLGFLSTLLGWGDEYVTRLFVEPRVLLYLGIVLFVATVGLDWLGRVQATEEG